MLTTTTFEKTAPQRLKMSYEEYLDFADNSKIIEWVEGEVIIYMPPVYEHQGIVVFLTVLLQQFIQIFDLGVLIIAPFEVKLWPAGPSREPDLMFVSHKNRAKLTSKRFEGGPDLIIEIISPSSVTEDRVRKFSQYEQASVSEYWVIDPRPGQHHGDFYVLGDDDIYHPAPVDEAGIYHSTVLPDFWFKLDWLWQDPLPNLQAALAEIMISIEQLAAEDKDRYKAIYTLFTAK